MNRKKIFLFGCIVIGLIGASFIKNSSVPFTVPKGWPRPVYDFNKNPSTEAGFQLGRLLFYDPLLSRDNTISCASCHLQSTGFTHIDHDLSHGIDGKIGPRNSMTIMNAAWNPSFMWDGAVNHLDVQALAPITNPLEMDETLENVVAKLNASILYRRYFYKAFGDSLATGEHTLLALSQFMLQLNTSNSRYDKYVRKESGVIFTVQEQNGLKIFETHCTSCHPAPLFTTYSFENNGLAIDPTLNDLGRFNVSINVADSFKFKVPTLRNIQFSGPYMHDGRFAKLTEVIEHYRSNVLPHTSSIQEKMAISNDEKVDLMAFLYTLSDTAFLFNPRYSFPRELIQSTAKE
jgi:cytochrome c peroxidase